MAECTPSRPKLETTCPICLDTFQRPRSLPCLHTFCTNCLQGHILNATQSGLLSAFFCPVCRAQTKPARPYSQRDTWAEQFPVNHWIISFMEETEKEESRNDTVVCEHHPEFTVRLFCIDHDCLCCPMCIATEHRKCDDVKELIAIAETFNASQERDLFRETLNLSENFIHDYRRARHVSITSFVSTREEIIQMIRAKREEIVRHLDAAEENILATIERRTDDTIQNIEGDIDWCNAADEIIDECKQLIDRNENDSSQLQSFIRLSQLKSKTKDILLKVQEKQHQPTLAIEMEFEFSEDMQNVHECFKSFGNLNIKSNDNSTESADTIESPDGDRTEQYVNSYNSCSGSTVSRESEQIQIPSRTTWYIDSYRGINHSIINHTVNDDVRFIEVLPVVENPSERKCWITSVVSMPNECIVVSDKTYNCLKMFKRGKLVSRTTLQSSPWDITRVNETSIAVTYPQENIVRFFDIYINDIIVKFMTKVSILGSPLKCTSTMEIPSSCFGITCLKKSVIVSCEDCLRMYSLKGKPLNSLSQNKNGEALFRRATFLASDTFRDVVFVSDEGNNCVIAIQAAHKSFINCPKYIYKHAQLRCPQGISICSDGSVFVCGFGSKNIHRVSSTGALIRIIETVLRPWTMAFLDCQSLFTLSVYPESEDCQDLYVYDLMHS